MRLWGVFFSPLFLLPIWSLGLLILASDRVFFPGKDLRLAEGREPEKRSIIFRGYRHWREESFVQHKSLVSCGLWFAFRALQHFFFFCIFANLVNQEINYFRAPFRSSIYYYWGIHPLPLVLPSRTVKTRPKSTQHGHRQADQKQALSGRIH